MKKVSILFFLPCFVSLQAQQNNVITVRDAFISIATDARAAGQGDIGVATSADAFSQFWNPSKYVFSDEKLKIGLTQIIGNSNELTDFNQVNIVFYNKLDNRSAYAISIRNYAHIINQFVEFGIFQATYEIAIAGSYSLRLSDEFSMSVAGRFISLKDKVPLLDTFNGKASLYGIDVSGFYFGNEIAYSKFNGRWRAGFNFSNLRGNSLDDDKDIEIYAPAMLKVGAGFDFIFDQDKILGMTTEYKMLLDSYVENTDGEKLDFGIEGSVVALGLEYMYKEKLIARTGYSHGINRLTDSFVSLGAGFRGRYTTIDIAFLLGLSEEENPIRENLRVSLSLNLEEVLSNLL